MEGCSLTKTEKWSYYLSKLNYNCNTLFAVSKADRDLLYCYCIQEVDNILADLQASSSSKL